MSMSSSRNSLASKSDFSQLPPIPTPMMRGGHQPAPKRGTVSKYPVHDGITWIERDEPCLILRPAALGAECDVEVFAGNEFSMNYRRRIVARVLARRVGKSHAFVDQVGKASSRRKSRVHTDFHELTSPVSWQRGRLPSADILEFTRI